MDTRQDLIDLDTVTEIVHHLMEKLRAYYVFPDVAEEICTRLQKYLADGEYEGARMGEYLALALTIHLQEVNHDEHLWVRWHPETLPENEGPLRQNPEWQAERQLEARLDNFGLYRAERLPGNVGCLEIHYFHRPAWGGDTFTATMNFLANTDALIMDLRRCTGGYPGMIALVCSYLFGEEPVHLESIYWRDEDVTQQYWTVPHLPGKRYTGKPVYILISEVTFSGGEDFAYIMKTRQRAKLVGEKTAGGANPGTSYRLHPHFEVFIPIGRVINPVTGTNWEGCGVIPDIPVSQAQAFQVAYQSALKEILPTLDEKSTGPYALQAQEIRNVLDNKEFR
jgi:retinol-binding protein 3